MKNARKTCLIIIIIIAETLLSIHIFNYTTRNKSPSGVWEPPEEISCIDASYTGDNLVSVIGDGRLFLMQGNAMSFKQTYLGSNPPISIKISKTGNYFASLDNESNLSLFSSIPITGEGQARPLWVKSIPGARLLDVYSNEGMPPLVYVLVSSDDALILIQKDGSIAWEYELTAENVDAVISYDGSRIAAVDSEGEIYLFNKNTLQPVWNYSSDLRGASVSITLRGERVAVTGKSIDDGVGELMVFSGRTGDLVLCREWGGEVGEVSISADGNRVCYRKGEEDFSVIDISGEEAQEQTIRVEGGLEYFAASTFSPYVAGVSSSDTVYLYYLDRAEPLWCFSPGSTPLHVSISQDGDTIFVGVKGSIFMLRNNEFSEMVPGSRLCWSIVFFSSNIAIILFFFAERTLNYFRGLSGLDVFLSIMCAVTWVIITGVFLEGSRKPALFGVGVLIGGLVYLKKKKLNSIWTGAFVGCLGSVACGLLASMIIWFRGSETSVIELAFTGVLEGVRMGAMSGLTGSVSALILFALYFKLGDEHRVNHLSLR